MKNSFMHAVFGPGRTLFCLVVIVFSTLSTNVIARDYSFGDYVKSRSTSTFVSLGLITATSALASQNPKAAGIGLVALSPLVGLRSYSRRGATSGLVSMTAIAGLGWYNLDELSKEKYSKTRVFEKDMIIMSSALGIGLLLEGAYYALGFQASSNFKVTPINEGLTLNYSYRF